MPKKPDPFAQFDEPETEEHVVESKAVSNAFPTITVANRIALIGEAPGADEVSAGKPFVGMSGRFLDQLLSKLGIMRAGCFVGNVCQIRPPGNDISKFDFNGPQIQSGLELLRSDLLDFSPNIVVLLGKTALFAARNTKNLGDWRGSVFMSESIAAGKTFKCLATYHPAACLRQYEFTPLLTFDLRRALKESFYPEQRLPARDLCINLSYEDLIKKLQHISNTKPPISCDIEGGVNSLSCLSIATSSTDSFLVPFIKLDGSSIWTNEQESSIWRLVACILGDKHIAKTWQNGLYDRFVLQHSYSIIVRGNADDTMLKWWEAYCELEKALSVQCSILTDEPFYKADRKTTDQDTFYRYCCRDSCVTYEINSKLTPLLNPGQLDHYRTNNSILNSLLYMELRGIAYDHDLAKTRLAEIESKVHGAQDALDELASSLGALDRIDFSLPNETIIQAVQKICCYKRDPTQPKKSFEEDGYYEVLARLRQATPLSNEERGTVSILCGLTMNTKSSKFKDFLYGTCRLPTQWKRDPTTREMRITTDYEALLKLTKTHDHPALHLALELSRLRTRAQMLAIVPYNGRMHCNYNLVGSETGRVTSSKSNLFAYTTKVKRVGANLQTVPDDWDIEDQDSPLAQGMRDLFLADPGCYLGKCDLKGADGWTVGAYMSMLGDPTMLDDLKFGLKPAQIVAYILKHGASQIQAYAKDRHQLKALCSTIQKDDWEYFVSKQGVWGSCYTMGPRKLAERVFIESEGKVNLTERQAREFQAAIYVRYRVKLWHDWMQRNIDSQSYPFKLTAPNGHIRKFFGRKSEILGEALAHMPQMVTTHATLQAAYRLWTDPDNRIGQSEGMGTSDVGRVCSSLRVEPLHQVHDELLVQFKIEDTSWAIDKLKSWFANPICVAGQTITIPFDGAYGTAWSMDENHKKGEIK